MWIELIHSEDCPLINIDNLIELSWRIFKDEKGNNEGYEILFHMINKTVLIEDFQNIDYEDYLECCNEFNKRWDELKLLLLNKS